MPSPQSTRRNPDGTPRWTKRSPCQRVRPALSRLPAHFLHHVFFSGPQVLQGERASHSSTDPVAGSILLLGQCASQWTCPDRKPGNRPLTAAGYPGATGRVLPTDPPHNPTWPARMTMLGGLSFVERRLMRCRRFSVCKVDPTACCQGVDLCSLAALA